MMPYPRPVVLLLLLLLQLVPCLAQQNADRPNILIIVSDDQGYGDLGCHGNSLVSTPYLDRLYTESARLTHFYTSPACAPTRASLMTGRYPYRTGVWDTWKGRQNMRGSEITLAEALRDSGYRTGHFGKWHLGENVPLRPQDQGFDETFLWKDISSRFDPGVEVNGKEVRMEGFLDDLIFDQAIDFLQQPSDKPFFCYVASFLPHDFPGKKQVPEGEVAPYLEANHLTCGDKETYAMITRMDRNLGRLLTALRISGQAANTIVVFLSDNGPQQRHRRDEGRETRRYNYGLRGDKGTVYEGGIRVPCFIRWPEKIAEGHDHTERTSVNDLFPTLLDLADIPSPAGVQIDGVSLAPLLLNNAESLPRRTLFHQFQRAAIPSLWANSSATGSRFKMVNGDELYDLIADPGETENLADEFPHELLRLRKAFKEWFASMSENPGFVGSRVWIGSELQPEVRFKYWHATQEYGYLTTVLRAGKYDLKITGLQGDLIGPDSRIAITANGEQVGTSAPLQNKEEIMLRGIPLPEGDTNLAVELRNPTDTRTLSYGESDPGYRFLFISPAD